MTSKRRHTVESGSDDQEYALRSLPSQSLQMHPADSTPRSLESSLQLKPAQEQYGNYNKHLTAR